jgi:hypothetical protein
MRQSDDESSATNGGSGMQKPNAFLRHDELRAGGHWPAACRPAFALLLAFLASVPAVAQFNAGTILGTVTDESQGAVAGASVTVRNVDTGVSRTLTSDDAGRFRVPNLPPGNYAITVDLTGFASYVRSGVTLAVNQDAVVDVLLKPARLTEKITVHSDAPLLDTTKAEVGVRFDTKRVAELPVANQRDVFALALSAPGVSQLGPGQISYAAGTNFAVNGARLRSNNFMIDGQDSNDPTITGRLQPINMTDVVQEIRLVTNQFTAEYGRAAGSVMNVVTKSGTNALHGSASWFANRDAWNSRSNLDEAAGHTTAPLRKTNQLGGTLGGPIARDRTFFFAGYQRWTDEALGSGQTLSGAPTEAGRQVLQQAAGHLPQVAALRPAAARLIGLVCGRDAGRPGAPRADPSVRHYRTGLLPWVRGQGADWGRDARCGREAAMHPRCGACAARSRGPSDCDGTAPAARA